MDEKRKFERFDLRLPATIAIGGKPVPIETHTRDISAGGACFETGEDLGNGAKLTIEILITNETLARLTGTQPKIKIQGSVVRSGPQGVAVCFEGSEKIMPLKSMMDH
jgi:hypothetical protein